MKKEHKNPKGGLSARGRTFFNNRDGSNLKATVVRWKEIMQGKLLRQVLDKMMTQGEAQNARVQVCLPNGKYYDIKSLQLMENKLIGHEESHRLVFTIKAETWNMGKVLKKIG